MSVAEKVFVSMNAGRDTEIPTSHMLSIRHVKTVMELDKWRVIMTKAETMVHVKEALDAIYKAEKALHETFDYEDEKLDKAFDHMIGVKIKLEQFIKEW